MNEKIIIGNVCFVKNTKNEVLLLFRNKPPMIGLYTGVGGKTYFQEDINTSCLREVKEETGLTVKDLSLKGVLKTILHETSSSWILFVYTASVSDKDALSYCSEGSLTWVPFDKVQSYDLIGFIKRIWPYVWEENVFFEGCVVHDVQGNVITDVIHHYKPR